MRRGSGPHETARCRATIWQKRSAARAEDVQAGGATPGAVTFGSPGNGTIGHLSMEMLKSMAKIDLLHIPYKGAALAITELIGGQIVIYGSSMPPALPLINAGKLRALGVTSARRLAPLPNVPTVAESGVKDYEAVNWYGVLTPAGVAKDMIAKVHADRLSEHARADELRLSDQWRRPTRGWRRYQVDAVSVAQAKRLRYKGVIKATGH